MLNIMSLYGRDLSTIEFGTRGNPGTSPLWPVISKEGQLETDTLTIYKLFNYLLLFLLSVLEKKTLISHL